MIDRRVGRVATRRREIKRKQATASGSPSTLARLATLIARAERIRTQQRKDKNKLYAMHAPEVECIGKGRHESRGLVMQHKAGLCEKSGV